VAQPQGRPGEKGEIGPIVSQFVTIHVHRVVTVPCHEVSHLPLLFAGPHWPKQGLKGERGRCRADRPPGKDVSELPYHFVTFVCVSICKSGSACITNSVHPSVSPSDFSQSVGLSICNLHVSICLFVHPLVCLLCPSCTSVSLQNGIVICCTPFLPHPFRVLLVPLVPKDDWTTWTNGEL